jgi:eukaryotic-like serine/threonine-protein kinase
MKVESPSRTVTEDGAGDVEAAIGLDARLGRYHLLGVLGNGGMSLVFEARDPAVDRVVAVKVLSAYRAGPRHITSWLQHEAVVMTRVTHPNVIRVHDVGIDHGCAFVVMELVRGSTLAEWIRRAPRSMADVLTMYVLAGRGLAAVHGAGLVHCDFKPHNVLVGDDGRVVLSDFGVARKLDERDRREVAGGAVAGTPAYMAPEQRAGGAVDARADQFSFCMALWEALHGSRPPLGGITAPPRAAHPNGADGAPIGRIPRRVRAALVRGLAADPAARWPSLVGLLRVIELAALCRRIPVA